MPARVGVVTFPGSLDDRDAQRAVRIAGGDAVPLWHADPVLPDVDAVILPGGFSYGDYLRCGAIARFAPVMEAVIAALATACPCSGYATASRCCARRTCCPARWYATTTEGSSAETNGSSSRMWSRSGPRGYRPGAEIVIPIKNGEGGYVADERTLNELEASGRVVVRYLGGNPNGSSATSPASATRRGTSSASCRTPSTRSTHSPARASTACLSSPGWPDRRA